MEGKQDTESEHGANHWPTIESSMYYLDQVPLYNIEKPYSMRYLPEEDIPQSNYVKVKRPISARSMREPGAGPFRIEECGFQMIDIHSHLTYDEFWDNERVQSVYIPEVKKALKLELGAKYVHYQYDQPTALAHIGKIGTLYGEHAQEILQHRWQIINTWRPLKGPLFDWPLAVCDAQTFDAAHDSQVADAVYPEWAYENVLIHAHPDQKWYYFAGLEESETMLFKCTDSDAQKCGRRFYLINIEKVS
ncbi:hypothetical protein TRIATDRAFT_217873 [Trichoderma atroviride IMI 206040]|uniref:Uncharacterized protein n=1 Tax=Hypocrea atroviridis (strain ATCC 20476 / IMI 206040) TaxID=452589 RepID=G9NQE2_HYPAI|nr:uncharacterized protein TRIATDRAFT_217873 [Trichoderma atroviride IMI 206040]EHK47286.1 hypothetical protein TRIATDRAFT_217873 [Trichoderma atroviride IMI 206040]